MCVCVCVCVCVCRAYLPTIFMYVSFYGAVKHAFENIFRLEAKLLFCENYT